MGRGRENEKERRLTEGDYVVEAVSEGKGLFSAGSPGFQGKGKKFLMGEKVHTIRKNERGYFKDGEGLSVREWSGAAYRSKQVEICALKSCGVVPIRLYRRFGVG